MDGLLLELASPDTPKAWPGIERGSVGRWRAEVAGRVAGIIALEDPRAVLVRCTEWALDAVDVAGMPLYIGARKSRSVSLSRRDMTANLAGFARAWADLKDGVAACRVLGDPSGLCGWCPLVNPCPVAAREGKGPRVAGLPLAQELGIPVWPAAEPPAQPRAGHVRTSGRKATGAILDDYE